MKATLQLKMNQQLAMTPQLQQAIRLLQLSTLDLQQEIQQALDDNPLLELDDDQEPVIVDERLPQDLEQQDQQPSSQNNEDHLAEEQVADSDWNEQIPVELATDSAWDDVYQSSTTPASGPADEFDFDAHNSHEPSLQEHLEWQLNLSRLSDIDQFIGASIIDAIDERGYLSQSVTQLTQGINRNLAQTEQQDSAHSVDDSETQAVLTLIQQFDPIGAGAEDLRQCLLIQLRHLPTDTPWRDGALNVVDKHLDLLGSHDYNTLRRRSGYKEAELQEIILLITQLQPEPGANIASSQAEYVIPDVMVRKVNNVWRVELNPDSAPKIRVNQQYADMGSGANSADKTYIKSHLQDARWFIKSLESRNDTLLKVAGRICEIQQGFLEYGEEAMKPLVLAEVAEHVEMHESTISRVTTQKYMHTPRGIFELKYFFSSHVATANGGECSSTAIRALIKKLVAAEHTRKPLSDSKLTDLLDQQGIKVARRTIAKYRESMNIPPSNERKRLS
ncbi:MAG TPA: RNA polymerase factor sigma-54 [Oceanospirillaceae bacterium]|nr:RNA polymerase factor sigma-54 [Oceanospirillaceae bacterium]